MYGQESARAMSRELARPRAGVATEATDGEPRVVTLLPYIQK